MDATEAAWTPLWDQAKAMGPDPELADLSNDEVEAEVRRGAAQIAALTCRWLLHVTELVVRGIWVDDGQRSPGAWLSWRVGVAPSTAREYVRVGLALRNAPKIRARFAAGTISYSKVRAITRVAAPETEDQLLDLADAAPAGQVERIIAGCRHQLAEHERWADGPPALDDGDPRDFQRLQRTPDTVEYRIRVSAADAAAVDARLARLVEREDRQEAQPRLRAVPDPPDADEGERDDTDDAPTAAPIGVRRAQAFLDALAVAVADHAPDRSGDDDHLVVLHVDQADLVAATAGDASAEADPVDDDARAATDDPPGAGASAEAPLARSRPSSPRRHRVVTGRDRGMSLPRSVIARLACDADLRLAAIDDTDDPRGHPADIGRRSRKVPADLRRALVLRDRHCRFPGCHNTRGLHAHHVIHWALGGPTDLANLLVLCPFHHRFVHDAGWELRPVAPADGRWTFHAPGSSAPRHPAPPLDGASAEAAGIIDDPHPQCLEPPWWNGAYDLSLTISVIADALEHLEPNVPDRGPHPWLTAA